MEKEHMEMFLEHIDTKFELMAEGYSLLSERIAQVENKIDQVAADAKFQVKIIDTKFNDQNLKFDARFNALEDRLDNHEDRFDSLEGRFERVQEHLTEQDMKLQQITDDLVAHRTDTEVHVGYMVKGHNVR